MHIAERIELLVLEFLLDMQRNFTKLPDATTLGNSVTKEIERKIDFQSSLVERDPIIASEPTGPRSALAFHNFSKKSMLRQCRCKNTS